MHSCLIVIRTSVVLHVEVMCFPEREELVLPVFWSSAKKRKCRKINFLCTYNYLCDLLNWYDYMNGVILLFLTAIDKLVKIFIGLRSSLAGIRLSYLHTHTRDFSIRKQSVIILNKYLVAIVEMFML